ncbi:HNH endonuclease [Paraburkholderia sp.]|uniref:HNH endonuclease n=1 Tax=Paraburkholderia sp. TaxID=1926495 RepID=UPI003C7DAFB6
MKLINLSKGFVAMVDDYDFEDLSQFPWHVTAQGYAARTTPRPNQTQEKMHRRIMSLKQGDPLQVDHINGDRLDNRRSNLRICSGTQNMQNQRIHCDNKSGYKGVRWCPWSKKKWMASIQANRGHQIYLGYYDTAEEAHEVYCLAADMLHGEFANHSMREAIREEETA